MSNNLKRSGSLLKRWSSWEDGIGHLIDAGGYNGMYFTNGFLGLKGELRVAPAKVDVPLTLASPTGYFALSAAATWQASGGHLTSTNGTDQVTVAGVAATGSALANTTLNISHVLTTTAATRCVIILIQNDSAANPTSVTYDFGGAGATAMSLSYNVGTTPRVHGYYLKNAALPTSGTYTVRVVFAGATDISAQVIAFDNVVQTGISFAAADTENGTTTGPILLGGELSSTAKGVYVSNVSILNVSATVTALEDDEETISIGSYSNADHSGASFYRNYSTTDWHVQYFLEDISNVGDNLTIRHMYMSLGKRSGGMSTIVNFRTNNSQFPTSQYNSAKLNIIGASTGGAWSPAQPGQPVRYQGYWWFPCGNDVSFEKLVIGTTSDTWLGNTTGFVQGADHLAMLGHRLISIVKTGKAQVYGLGGSGANAGGARVLAVDGAPNTAANWGSAYQVGDTRERATGIISLEGKAFVTNTDGLYSFNSKGRSGLVFEDLKLWRTAFVNSKPQPWRGGFLMSHPTGLIFYYLGSLLPVRVGVDAVSDINLLPSNSTLTELHGGRYHGVYTAGDYVYAIYQPKVDASTAYVLCAYTRYGSPFDLVWQNLGEITLNDKYYISNCFVTTMSQPLSASYETPVLWFQDESNISYIILDQSASPFKARSITHDIVSTATATFSEFTFNEKANLTNLVVYAADMLTTDVFHIYSYFDNNKTRNYLGKISRGGRHVLDINNITNIHKVILEIDFATSDTTTRIPPSIQRVELYGIKGKNT